VDVRRHGRTGQSPDARPARVRSQRARSSLARGAPGVPGADTQDSCSTLGRAPQATADALAIVREHHGSRLHLIVSGTLDATTAPRLRAECGSECVDDIDVALLDVAHVTSMDRTGLQALFAANEHFGERLSIIVGPPCAHVIHLTGSRDKLPIIEG
jgi:anti-anti-sigma regulatory factor